MISLHRSMHSSQMYTPGPAISFLTCFWLFPQKEHFSRSPPSPIRATGGHPPVRPGAGAGAFVAVRYCCREPLDGPSSAPVWGGSHTDLCRASGGSAGRLTGGSGECGCGLAGVENRVDQTVLDRLLRGED